MKDYVSLTELRKNIYSFMDEVAEKGAVLELKRNGKKIKILRDDGPAKLERLINPFTTVSVGNSDDFVSMDWSVEWKPGSI